MIRIALIGEIASGKTFVAKCFGYPIFNADEEVEKILRSWLVKAQTGNTNALNYLRDLGERREAFELTIKREIKSIFEVFAMGLESEGNQTPQQKGFMSLNTFMAEDYNTPAATEVPDKKYKPEEAINNLALNTRNRNSTIKNYNYGPMNDSDEEYWEKVADLWDTNTKVAKESRCHNCAAFDRKPDTLKKIAEVMGPDGKKIVEIVNTRIKDRQSMSYSIETRLPFMDHRLIEFGLKR